MFSKYISRILQKVLIITHIKNDNDCQEFFINKINNYKKNEFLFTFKTWMSKKFQFKYNIIYIII